MTPPTSEEFEGLEEEEEMHKPAEIPTAGPERRNPLLMEPDPTRRSTEDGSIWESQTDRSLGNPNDPQSGRKSLDGDANLAGRENETLRRHGDSPLSE